MPSRAPGCEFRRIDDLLRKPASAETVTIDADEFGAMFYLVLAVREALLANGEPVGACTGPDLARRTRAQFAGRELRIHEQRKDIAELAAAVAATEAK